MREWVISFYLERLNMTNTKQPNPLVFNEHTGRILLDTVDITENVIHVMIEWLVHTEAAITVFDRRTQQQKLITCVVIPDEGLSTNSAAVH